MKHSYEIVVIGGGHAGSEAAYAAARGGSRVALVTKKKDQIGSIFNKRFKHRTHLICRLFCFFFT